VRVVARNRPVSGCLRCITRANAHRFFTLVLPSHLSPGWRWSRVTRHLGCVGPIEARTPARALVAGLSCAHPPTERRYNPSPPGMSSRLGEAFLSVLSPHHEQLYEHHILSSSHPDFALRRGLCRRVHDLRVSAYQSIARSV